MTNWKNKKGHRNVIARQQRATSQWEKKRACDYVGDLWFLASTHWIELNIATKPAILWLAFEVNTFAGKRIGSEGEVFGRKMGQEWRISNIFAECPLQWVEKSSFDGMILFMKFKKKVISDLIQPKFNFLLIAKYKEDVYEQDIPLC